VQRERFGGIIGAVTDGSGFPVTKEGALSVVGKRNVMGGIRETDRNPQTQYPFPKTRFRIKNA
jgi:HlyD family secretion protein